VSQATLAACQASYDRVAEEYARRIYGELQHKPLDRQLLDQLVRRVGALGPICDLGCGPGHVARYLHEQGANVLGIDLSPGMVEMARHLSPAISFQPGNMLALDVEDNAWGGIAAFYSIIHIPHAELLRVLVELRRVLKPGGWLLVAFHIGEEMVHLDEWWGERVGVDFYFYQAGEMSGYLAQAGFVDIEVFVRDSYPAVEYQSRRAYIFAHTEGSGLKSHV
jgi:SAM-dependent methyltransferase